MTDAAAPKSPESNPRRRTPIGRRVMSRTGLIVLAVFAAAVIALVVAVPWGNPVQGKQHWISVTDGPATAREHVRLDTALYVPHGVNAHHRAPAIILAHGFGGSRHTLDGEAQYFAARGFVVLAYTARGFGSSGGRVALDARDYEVNDEQQLVTWLAKQPEVQLDHPGDPRVGIVGASYGGGASLMLVASDPRVDAAVPSITWNSLGTALSPNAATGVGPQVAALESGQVMNDAAMAGQDAADAADAESYATRAWQPAAADAATAAPYGVFKKAWAAALFSAAGDRTAPDEQEPGASPASAGNTFGRYVTATGAPTTCGHFTDAICSDYAASAA
jgi:ABC-2 type transport system ATP-binding protein